MRRRERDDAFHAFFESESDPLRRFGAFLVGDAEQGAELAQEALVRVYKNWSRIEDADPGPYARRILVNLVRSAHRRRLVERKHLRPVEDIGRHDTVHVDNWLRVSAALQTLPPMRRAAIVLRFYEDLPEAQAPPCSTGRRARSSPRRGHARGVVGVRRQRAAFRISDGEALLDPFSSKIEITPLQELASPNPRFPSDVLPHTFLAEVPPDVGQVNFFVAGDSGEVVDASLQEKESEGSQPPNLVARTEHDDLLIRGMYALTIAAVDASGGIATRTVVFEFD